METLEAIAQRRSVKHYDPAAKLSDAEFNQLMEHVLLSPTSYNIQNWRFVRVRDATLREKIKAAAWGQAQVTDASELFIFCASLLSYNDRPERYWRNADEATQAMLLPMMHNFYEGKPALQRDEAMRSCGIAAQTMMLAAKAMGWDSCPMIGFDPDAVAELIQLPENYAIGMMVVVGKAKEPARPRGGQVALEEVLIENTF